MKITKRQLRRIIREAILSETAAGKDLWLGWTPAGADEKMFAQKRANSERTIWNHYTPNRHEGDREISPEALKMIDHGKKAMGMSRYAWKAARNYMQSLGLGPDAPGLTGAESTYEENYGQPLTFHQELEIVIMGLKKGEIE